MNLDKKIYVYTPRFPRVNTAQTQALMPVETAETEDILFPELIKFEKESHND